MVDCFHYTEMICLPLSILTQARQMHRHQGTSCTRGLIVPLLQIYVVNGRIAGRASEKVELPGVGGDDGVSLQAPVCCGRSRAESQGLVRCCSTIVDIQVQLRAVRVIERDCASEREAPRRRLRTQNGLPTCNYTIERIVIYGG